MAAMWWRAYLVVGVLTIVAYPFVPSGLGQDLVYMAVGGSSVAAIVLAVRLHRPVRVMPWYLMASGELLWVVGDGIDSWYDHISVTPHFPSIADAFYLIAYPMLAAGLVLLIRGRRPRRDPAGLLDSAIVTVGFGLVLWVLVAEPTLETAQDSFAGAAVGVAYPIADILLVGLLVRLLTTPGGRTAAWKYLMVAVTLLIAGDTISATIGLFSSSSTNTYDVIWLASYVAWGTAALHPSMYSLSERTTLPWSEATSEYDRTFTRSRLAALTLATLIAPAILAFERIAGLRLDIWPVVTGSIVLFLLVVARMTVALQDTARANRVREVLQTELAYQVAHDTLTMLPNRAEALRLMKGALSRAERTGAMIALLFIDLDGFKAVNDTLGHGAGDDVLRTVALRMQEHVRGGDVVARLGGDEFVVLLEPIEDEAAALAIADRLVEASSVPITTSAGHEVRIGTSVGVAFSQDGFINPDRLLLEADTAVYRAKAAGRGRVEVFDHALRTELTGRALLEASITRAIEHDELVLHYQPIIDLRTGGLRGFEALIRWQRPGIGLVPPADFVPIAEMSNLIMDLDSWALAEATSQLRRWTDTHDRTASLDVAVKVSGRHISNPRILTDVADALRRSGLRASRLVLEITETVLMDELRAIYHLEELRKTGVRIGIDHFGTGYSSLARLQHLPIDIIKIDKEFLGTQNASSWKLLDVLIRAAHVFDIPVIAEGVESREQLEHLEDSGCDAGQGYHLGRPMTPADGDRLLTERATL